MRIIFAVPLLAAICACEANVDDANDSVTLRYDENLAEETGETVINETEQIAGDIANDVSETAARVENEVGRTDVDVDVSRDGNSN